MYSLETGAGSKELEPSLVAGGGGAGPGAGAGNPLPHTDLELDNLTKFNTAHNRRINSLGVDSMAAATSQKRVVAGVRRKRPHNVHFNDTDEVINPEDVDPSVGRFRNLVQETFIPNKVIALYFTYRAWTTAAATTSDARLFANVAASAHSHRCSSKDGYAGLDMLQGEVRVS